MPHDAGQPPRVNDFPTDESRWYRRTPALIDYGLAPRRPGMAYGLAVAHLYGWTIGRKICNAKEPVMRCLQAAAWLQDQGLDLDVSLLTERTWWRPRPNWKSSRRHPKTDRRVYLDDIEAADVFLARVDAILRELDEARSQTVKVSDTEILRALLIDGLTTREAAKKLGVHYNTVWKQANDAEAAIVAASPKLIVEGVTANGDSEADAQKCPSNKNFSHVNLRGKKSYNGIVGPELNSSESGDPFALNLYNEKQEPIDRVEIRRRTARLIADYHERGEKIQKFADGLAWGISAWARAACQCPDCRRTELFLLAPGHNIRGAPLSALTAKGLDGRPAWHSERWHRVHGAQNTDQELSKYFARLGCFEDSSPKRSADGSVMDRRYGVGKRKRGGFDGLAKELAGEFDRIARLGAAVAAEIAAEDSIDPDEAAERAAELRHLVQFKNDTYEEKDPAPCSKTLADGDNDVRADTDEAQQDDTLPPERLLRKLKLPSADVELAELDALQRAPPNVTTATPTPHATASGDGPPFAKRNPRRQRATSQTKE